LKQINKFKSTNKLSNLDRENIINSLKKIDSVLGVIFKESKSKLVDTINVDEKNIQEKIVERNEARKNKRSKKK